MPTRSWTDLLDDAGETGNYDPLPEGDYDFVIKEANAKTASTGRTMYVAKMAVEGGPFNGKTVWHNFVLVPENPTALGWFFKNMGTLGLGQEYFKSNPSDHHVAEALVGRRFRGQVVIRKWQGQDKNEIKAFFPPAGAAVGSGNGGASVPPTATAHAAPQPPAAPVTPPPAPPAAPAPPPVQAPPTPPVQAEAEPAPAPTVAPEPAPNSAPDPVSGNGNGEAKEEQQKAAEETPTPPAPTSNTPAEAPAAPEQAPEPETAAAGSIPPPPPF